MSIQSLKTDTQSDRTDYLDLTEQVVACYGLNRWAAEFSLMTAGYRDHIDPDDAWNPGVPFNGVTVAIMTEARARVLQRRFHGLGILDLHVGGEVRTHTQIFIKVAARVYAAHGFRVHLRRGVDTSPIWYSSFGVFYSEYGGGDNFTASHSPFFKLGWKVLDHLGKQLSEEEDEVIAEVRKVVADGSKIRLAPWSSSGLIVSDFSVDDPYAAYQESALGSETLAVIRESALAGFRCAAYTLGGSMGGTSKRILQQLGIPASAVTYFLDSEDSRFHRVGEINGNNFGGDVGNVAVCKNTGAPIILLNGQADLVLLWDPDGDRLNLMTTAPEAFRQRATEFGLSLGDTDGQRMVVFLTPNQLYLLLAEYRIKLLKKLGLLNEYDWFIGMSFPTSMAIEELAQQEGIPTIRVPVGFRNLGDLCQTVEGRFGSEQIVTTLTGRQIRLGPTPRALLLCEESGGATLGGPDLMFSKSRKTALLALREKDGMQLALLAWAMAASQHKVGVSIAEQYCDIISRRGIQFRYSQRVDISLYNESLVGPELEAAKSEGIIKRDKATDFFRNTATALSTGGKSGRQIMETLTKANPEVSEALSPIDAAAWIGDGSLFEMDGARVIVRASGTDALVRYYVETTSQDRLNKLVRFVSNQQF